MRRLTDQVDDVIFIQGRWRLAEVALFCFFSVLTAGVMRCTYMHFYCTCQGGINSRNFVRRARRLWNRDGIEDMGHRVAIANMAWESVTRDLRKNAKYSTHHSLANLFFLVNEECGTRHGTRNEIVSSLINGPINYSYKRSLS